MCVCYPSNMNGDIEAIKARIIEKDIELSHTLLKDHPEGDWIDGYFDALEWVLALMEGEEE